MTLEILATLLLSVLVYAAIMLFFIYWSMQDVKEKISDIKSELREIKHDADRIRKDTDCTKDCLIGKSYAFDNLCKKVDDINIRTHIKF